MHTVYYDLAEISGQQVARQLQTKTMVIEFPTPGFEFGKMTSKFGPWMDMSVSGGGQVQIVELTVARKQRN